MNSPPIQRALISVSDKHGLVDFARSLIDAGIEIFSTGGTRRHLEAEGLPVVDISQYTGCPEMMDGRLKTLHPNVFGGILCRHDRSDDMDAIAGQGIHTFELVVVNLYPFAATIAREGVTPQDAIEQIDIGGPSLVRAAAKNHAFVTIATNPEQYSSILNEISGHGCTSPVLRSRLMAEAFAHTAAYDRVIANYFASEDDSGGFPPTVNLSLRRESELRYGENPHQAAALYSITGEQGANLVSAQRLNGKALSYNNLLDLDSALSIVRSLPDAAAVVIKHNNPCGAASAAGLCEAAEKAMAGDPVSAFGSVLGFNQTVDATTAEFLSTPGFFVEAIVAPEFEAAAIDILTTKPKWKDNVRLMQVGQLHDSSSKLQYRNIDGGMLVQEADVDASDLQQWRVVTDAVPADGIQQELEFAWGIVRHVKSNAITLSRDRALCGCGAGQMSRVDSVEIAIRKAGDRAQGSILASDAFFPFPDSIQRAAEAGVTAVIQPGGSRRDSEVIAACNELGLPMILTGRRHFKH
jgi:phosphoribosylaminoimidazolecarboxamide formyltransferase/IMP cyclohydrolase